MGPILEEVKNKMGDKTTILKVDVDKNPSAAVLYKVQSVPTLLLFKQGEIIWRQTGIVPAEHLIRIIELHQ